MGERWERTGEHRTPKPNEWYESENFKWGPAFVTCTLKDHADNHHWILRKVEEPTLGQKLVSRVQDIHDSLQPASEGETYRTPQEVLEAIETEWGVVLNSSLRRLIIEKVSRHRPPCTCRTTP